MSESKSGLDHSLAIVSQTVELKAAGVRDDPDRIRIHGGCDHEHEREYGQRSHGLSFFSRNSRFADQKEKPLFGMRH